MASAILTGTWRETNGNRHLAIPKEKLACGPRPPWQRAENPVKRWYRRSDPSFEAGARMAAPRVLILRAPGANCDGETQFAFEQAGGVAERLHINRLRENPKLLKNFQILA